MSLGETGAAARGLVISAPASGSGKTSVTLGLLAALRRRGVAVRSAKSGPDYIDPAFHAAATGAPCVTLDAWAMAPEQVAARAAEAVAGIGDPVLIVEGAMGLFDGADDETPAGCGSTADVAAALDLPVIAVVDAARMGQGAAALVRGLAAHRADVRLAGVILNRVGSARHGAMLCRAVGTVAPVLGCLPRREDLVLPSRHLGLVQAGEREDLARFIGQVADWVVRDVDLDALERLAAPLAQGGAPRRIVPPGQRVAVASDLAFAFCYPHMLADWRAAGAEVIPFSPLADEVPDGVADAIFLPGGYPELHAGRLAGAARFREGIAAALARGATVYGECGGYMVMGDGLVDADGTRHRMLGLLRLETSFEEPERHLGYRRLEVASGPWAGSARAHEFHYARTMRAEGEPFATARDAAGRDLGAIGLREGAAMGSFAHLIETG